MADQVKIIKNITSMELVTKITTNLLSSPSSKCGEGPGPYKTLCPPPKGAEMAKGGRYTHYIYKTEIWFYFHWAKGLDLYLKVAKMQETVSSEPF